MGLQLRVFGKYFKTIQKKIVVDTLNHFAERFVRGDSIRAVCLRLIRTRY